MSSHILDYFGSPNALRQALRGQLKLMMDGSSNSTTHFFLERSNATDMEVRQLRKSNFRRERIYNYERDKARDWFHTKLYLFADEGRPSLANYSNGTKMIQINTKHHPILVKVLTSELASYYPDVTITLGEWGRPIYNWDRNRTEPNSLVSDGLRYVYVTNPTPDIFFDEHSSMSQVWRTQ